MQTDLMQTLRWLRMIGDTIFALNLVWQRPDKKAVTVRVVAEGI